MTIKNEVKKLLEETKDKLSILSSNGKIDISKGVKWPEEVMKKTFFSL